MSRVLSPGPLYLRLALMWQGEHFILRRPGMEFQAKDSFGRKFKGKVRNAAAPVPGRRLVADTRLHFQGELHVSTIRMVFINHSGGDMQAFDLPMANITNEKFNQPIFGANNISGTVAAVRPAQNWAAALLSHPDRDLAVLLALQIANEQAGVTGQLEFKLWFNEGGCHTFLRVFFNAMEQLRSVPIGALTALSFATDLQPLLRVTGLTRANCCGPRVATPVVSEFTQAVVAGTFVQAAFVDPNDPSSVYVTQVRNCCLCRCMSAATI